MLFLIVSKFNHQISKTPKVVHGHSADAQARGGAKSENKLALGDTSSLACGLIHYNIFSSSPMEAEAQLQGSDDLASLRLPAPKSQAKQEKRELKEAAKARIRKNSTQLSLFAWLVRNRPKQTGEL
jgi:hypothetical protein